MSTVLNYHINKLRKASISKKSSVFTDIYQDEVNIAIWQRKLSSSLSFLIETFLKAYPSFTLSMTVKPNAIESSLSKWIDPIEYRELFHHIIELVDMFSCLFELKFVGVRLIALDKAMCPKFHVDHVPCRLISTFQGAATEWLPHPIVDRTKLGAGSNGLKDADSGLYPNESYIQQLRCGDVALLKGESWFNNEHCGIVHRSPPIHNSINRLLLTLDFAD